MVQYLLDVISITDMGIYVKSFGSEAAFQTLKILFCLLNDFLRFHTWKSTSRDNSQKANTFFRHYSQLLNLGDYIFITLRTVKRNQDPFVFLHKNPPFLLS
jgi:hypothetical protein